MCAQTDLTPVRRIMIIGGPGAGKTWLSQRLSDQLSLPVFAVDDAVWSRTGELRAPEDIDAIVREWAAKDQWIIEGGNSRTYADRARRADAVILLQPPRWVRVCRVFLRDGLRWRLLWWSIQYDHVFGEKDRSACAMVAAGAQVIETSAVSLPKDLLSLRWR